MEAQFEAMEGRLEELTIATAQPEIIADVPKWQAMLKEMRQLEPAVNAWREYKQMLERIRQAGQQYAETGEIEEALLAEIGSPMIPEEQYAAIVNGGL